MRNNLYYSIKSAQANCNKDVQQYCSSASDYANPQKSAYTDWHSSQYKRHTYKQWVDVPLGFGDGADGCIRDEFYKNTGSTKLSQPCTNSLTKTETQFDKLYKREKGNDKREMFVIFSTIFATVVSGGVGYLIGLFLKERDDFAFLHEAENKRTYLYLGIAVSLPVIVILWACPRLLMLMGCAFWIGRGVQYYIQKKEEGEYASVPGSDSGLVFAAIPVQLE